MLGQCIAAEPDMETAGCLHSADDLLTTVQATRADVVILDMKMPGRDPLAALKDLTESTRGIDGADKDLRRAVRVIAYSGRDDQVSVDRALSAGAWAYVCKDAEIPRVLEAIRDVAQGKAGFELWS